MQSADFNRDDITLNTKLALEQGLRVLQPYYLAPTQVEHLARLAAWMDLPAGARVLDAGCGVGEVASALSVLRPDLHFTLLNANEYQLSQCPTGPAFTHVLGDFHAIPADAGSFDVVMFQAAFCHGDPQRLFAESSRVLKPGGRLHLFDMCRSAGDNAGIEKSLASFAWYETELAQWANEAGFSVLRVDRPQCDSTHFRAAFADPAEHDREFAHIYPILVEFEKRPTAEDVIPRHKKIALELSGGKDSLASLLMLRPYWDRITVYWMATGSTFPETVQTLEHVKALGVRVVTVQADVVANMEQHGIPSDIVPVSATPMGHAVGVQTAKIQSRYDCCARSLMLPLHVKVVEDGNTLIIRGQKAADQLKGPLRSGQVIDGIEYFYPIEGWTDQQVLAYLKEQDFPVPRFYTMLTATPDCMDCSAWWEEGRAAYLKQHHPDAYERYMDRLAVIHAAVSQHTAMFNKEIE